MSDVKIKQIDPSQIRYTPEENEIIQNPEGEYLIWKDGACNKINVEGSDISMGLYDMNKQIIAQLPTLTDDELNEKKYSIDALNAKYNNEYYMLYGKEISYFTLFKIVEPQYFSYEVIECLKNVGDIKAIDLTEDKDAVEIWVMADGKATCLYLFPYDLGIVQVGE
jgi:hypothetical protein